MSLDTSQSRIWPRIFAAIDGHRKKILLPQRIPPEMKFSSTDSEQKETESAHTERKLQIKAMNNKQVSLQASTLETKPSKQPITYDERAIAEALKDINSEIDTLQSLYNSQWFADKRIISGGSKPEKQGTDASEYEKIIKLDVFQDRAHSTNETNILEIDQNDSAIREARTPHSKLLGQLKEHEKDTTNFSLAQKKLQKSLASQRMNDKPIRVMSEIEPNTLTEAEREAFKKAVTAVTAKTKIAHEKRVQRKSPLNDTPAQMSNTSHRQLQGEGNKPHSDADGCTNALTDAERQTFKEAFFAMKAETEKEERSIAKESAKSALSRKATSFRSSKEQIKLQKSTGRTISRAQSNCQTLYDNGRKREQRDVAKMIQSQTSVYKPPLVQRVSRIQTGKLNKTPEESQIRRGLLETKKTAPYFSPQLAKSSSLKTSVSTIKNGNFQAGFVTAVPLKADVLQIRPTLSLVTRHCAPKKGPTKAPLSNFRK